MATSFSVHGNPPIDGWSSGLYDCFDDVDSCCLTLFCPCVTFGRIATIVDQGAISCCSSGTLYTLLLSEAVVASSLYTCCYRARLRSHYGLTEKPCNDCCVHLFCDSCALCQEYRELKARGFDMSLGWYENVERMGKGSAARMAPPHIGMFR